MSEADQVSSQCKDLLGRRRFRILLSAFAFDTVGGSEAGLGWQIAKRLSLHHDVTVIFGNLGATDVHARLDRLQSACANNPNLSLCFVDGDAFSTWLARWSGFPGLWWLYYKAYRRWQRLALRKARGLHAHSPFDLAHHLNFISYREPGELWKLGIPFFWGPITGAPMVPLPFLQQFHLAQFYRWGSRNLVNWFQMRLSKSCKRAAAKASTIWTVSKEDSRMVETFWGGNAEPLLETGCEISDKQAPRSRQSHEPLKIIWSGRFDSIKVLPVVLDALANLREYPVEIDIIGDGPERTHWKAHANKLNLGDRIFWHGMVPRGRALGIMSQGHVFCHSSVKEGTPHVVLEALSLGLPVICHDACGMGIAVDATCGIKVTLRDPSTSVSGFSEALRTLLNKPEMFEMLSAGALKRAAELSWESKISAFLHAYDSCLSKRSV